MPAGYSGKSGAKIAAYDGEAWHVKWLRKGESAQAAGRCPSLAFDDDGVLHAAFTDKGRLWIAEIETPTGNSDPDILRVDFEENDARPWRYSSEDGRKAVFSTSTVSDEAFNKEHSLAADFRLDAQDPDLAFGEVWRGFCGNLDGQPFNVWVKFDDDSAVGDPENPNRVRLFVKDQNGRRQSCLWKEIGGDVVVGRWTRLYFYPQNTPSSSCETDEGFDAEKIAAVGIEISAGPGSTVPAEGRFYMDFALVEREPGSGSDGVLDYNGDCRADLADLVIVNRILVGDSVEATWGRCFDLDVDGDGKIGFGEAGSLLRSISGLE